MSPLKMFEYMAAGKPIIASDLPVLREVLAHEHNALLVPPQNLEAWLAAVRRLQDDEQLRQELGRTASREQASLYSWDARARTVLAGLSSGPVDLCILRPTMGQGGADRVTATLLRSLDRRRFRPSLALMRAEGALLEKVPADVLIHELGGNSLWTAWWPLARLLRRSAPRVLLSTSGGANLIAVLGQRFCGRPMRVVLSERNMLYRDQGRLKRWLQMRLKRMFYPRADCLTTVSEGVRKDLVTRLRLPPNRVEVVYNPVVTPEISSLAAAGISHPWFAEGTTVVLGVGRLVPAKGFDVLIDAFAQLRARRPARLALLGEGPEHEALVGRAGALGVAESVWFAGFDPNPFRYMARCSVFVLSSRHEGLPGVLIQAMACGAAVVATDCPSGPAEIVEDGVSGFLVPVNNASAISQTIERLLDEPELAARLGRAARQAVQRFSVETALEAYVGALTGDSATASSTP